MQPRIYTYKVVFPAQGWWYWGVHKERKYGEIYHGSPITHKDKWDLFHYEVRILEFFDSWDDALKVEQRLIKPDLNNPRCLNECRGGGFSQEALKKGGQTAIESGHIFRIATRETRAKGGKVNGLVQGKKNVESGQIYTIATQHSRMLGGQNTSKLRYRCLVTGYISTPGGLSAYQKKRGIDPMLREKI